MQVLFTSGTQNTYHTPLVKLPDFGPAERFPLLTWSCTPGNEPLKLYFTQDFTMDEQQASDCHATELYARSIRLVKRLEALGILREEYLALKALLLANADIQLEEPQSVHKLRDSILNALQNCVTVFRSTNCVEHLSQLMLCLPLLRQLDTEVRLFWSNVRKDGKVTLNKLFVEMLESNGHLL
ncbi:UNVERIFIED_CONTAM: Esrrg [Trichonephila clavipes]